MISFKLKSFESRQAVLTGFPSGCSDRQTAVKVEVIVVVPDVLAYVIEVKSPAISPSRCCRTSEMTERQAMKGEESDVAF